MMNTRRLLAGLGFGILALMMCCVIPGLSPQAVGATGKPIVIGEVTDFTGPSSTSTKLMIAAMELAVHEYGGQVAGRPIKMIHEDGGGDPAMSVDKARKLVERDKAAIIIGPIAAVAAMPVNAYLQRSGIPHICMELPAGFHKKGGNLFSQHGTLSNDGYIMGKYAAEVLGHKTATVIHDDIVFAEAFCQGAMDGFVSAGGKIIQRQRTPMSAMEYGPFLSAMKKADVCLFWFVPPHAMRFVSQYTDYGLKMPLVVTGISILGKPLLNQLGDKAVGIYAMATNDADIDLPGVKAWLKRWKALYGDNKELSDPGFSEVCNWYVQTLFALEAIKATKGDTSPKKLSDALRRIKLQTPWGQISFNDRGISIGNVHIQRIVKDGNRYKYQTVKKYEQILREQPAATRMAASKM